MSLLKKIFSGLIITLIVSAIIGYFYFDKKFTPPPNQLDVDHGDERIRIKWLSDETSDIAALLVPVKLNDLQQTFYMQFDLGAHSTMFYKNPLESLEKLYPKTLSFTADSGYLKDVPIQIGNMKIRSNNARLLNYGASIEAQDTSSIHIIGTLGSDLIEKKVVVIDFIKGLLYLKDHIDLPMTDFSFTKRKVLLPATLNGSDLDLLYDSGSSGFELITSESTWNEMGEIGGETTSFNVNSWGKSLKAYTVACKGIIGMGSSTLNLSSVTYIDGTSYIQNMLMRATGMGGMIGNKLFMNKVLILDGKNEQFVILDEY